VDPEQITLGLVLTTGGAAIFAALITGIVEIFSRTISAIQGHEQGLVLVLAGVAVVAAIAEAVNQGVLQMGIGTVFAGILAWYGVARISMGIHDDFLDRNPESSLGTNV
jgi:hypothetical protein